MQHLNVYSVAAILGQTGEPKRESCPGFKEEILRQDAGSLLFDFWKELPRAEVFKHGSTRWSPLAAQNLSPKEDPQMAPGQTIAYRFTQDLTPIPFVR
jgi:hypothetical protein